MTPLALRTLAAALLLASTGSAPLSAQAAGRVHGFPSPWFGATVGAGQLSLSCPTCSGSDRIGGAAYQIGAGLAATDQIAFGVEARGFLQLAEEFNQNARIVTGVIQFLPARLSGMSFEVGAGHASLSRDGAGSSTGDGSATVLELGTAVRLPETSVVAFTLQASYLKAISGRHEANGALFPAGEWRPSLFMVGLGADLRFLP